MARDNLGAGDLRDLLHFQSRGMVDDGFGNMVPGGDFVTQFTVRANLLPLRGTETVMAARMEGRQPYIATVYQTENTRQITTAWQAVNANNANRIFAVTAPPVDPDSKRQWLEILVTEGAAS